MNFIKGDILINIGDDFFWFVHILSDEDKEGCYSDIIAFSVGDITTHYNNYSKLNVITNFIKNPNVYLYRTLLKVLFS